MAKIIIVADSVAEARADLEMIEKAKTEFQIDIKEEVVEVHESKDIDTSIEDELDTKFTVEDVEIDDGEKELDKVVEDVIENKEPERKNKPQLLDDLEKTSTLQILDDIEKELNSIKPISKEYNDEEEYEVRVRKDDTLEKDLFNLIDSMYEEGEEDEDNG